MTPLFEPEHSPLSMRPKIKSRSQERGLSFVSNMDEISQSNNGLTGFYEGCEDLLPTRSTLFFTAKALNNRHSKQRYGDGIDQDFISKKLKKDLAKFKNYF